MTTEWALALTIMGRRLGSLLSPASGGLGGGVAQMKIIAGLPRVFAKQSGGKFRYVRSVFRVFSVFRGFNSCKTIHHNLFPQAALCKRNVNDVITTTEHTEHTEDVWSDSVKLSGFLLCRCRFCGTHIVSGAFPNYCKLLLLSMSACQSPLQD